MRSQTRNFASLSLACFLLAGGATSSGATEERQDAPAENQTVDAESEEEILARQPDLNRSDVTVGLEQSSNGIEVVATVSALANDLTYDFTIFFEFEGGATPSEPIPEQCSEDLNGLVCVLPMIFVNGDDPIEFPLLVDLEPTAASPVVTATATSRFNPVSNDPNPDDNVASITLGS